MFEGDLCETTVSLTWAILFGADGACVTLGTGSVVGFVALFVVAVIALKLLGRAAFDRVFASPMKRAISGDPGTSPSAPGPHEGPEGSARQR